MAKWSPRSNLANASSGEPTVYYDLPLEPGKPEPLTDTKSTLTQAEKEKCVRIAKLVDHVTKNMLGRRYASPNIVAAVSVVRGTCQPLRSVAERYNTPHHIIDDALKRLQNLQSIPIGS